MALSNMVRRLCLYNLFNSLAITPACNVIFADKLMLRMEIDLDLFGMIKGFTYLIPTVLYQLAVPLLQRLKNDVGVTVWCYLLRALLPALLPILALFTDNKSVLTLSCILVFSTAMTMAVFANNSLLAIYRTALPKEDFNSKSGLIALCTSMPARLLGLPLAWWLDCYETASNHTFFMIFALIHLLCLFFEIPAFRQMRGMNRKIRGKRKTAHHTRGGMLSPYFDRIFAPVLGIQVLQGILFGLIGAYLTVYLLKGAGLSLSVVTMISTGLAILLYLSLPVCGAVADRIGYQRLFFILSGVMLAGHVLFCSVWDQFWVLLLFMLIMGDGNSALVSGSLQWGLNAAASKLLRRSLSGCYIAALSVCFNGGIFAGSLLAGWLFSLALRTIDGDVYRQYFLYTLAFSVLLFLAAGIYRFYAFRRAKN